METGNDLTGWQKYLDVAAPLNPGLGYAINPKCSERPFDFGVIRNRQ